MTEQNTHLSAPGVPHIPSVSQQQLSRAWETFVDSGRFAGESPRSVIARSWERSREIGLNPRAERAPTVLSNEEIEAWLVREDLGRAGRPVLDELANTVRDTRHVIVLADHQGRILYSVGHDQIQEHLERINFRPGGGWLEADVGPNGIGTPLALQRPEVVLGVEHYCQGWQPWVCYGAPIINPLNRRQPLGAVDITGPVQNISQEAMVLAVSIAQTVQSALSVRLYERRELLRGLARDKRSRWPDDGVIVVDMNGDIVDTNNRASRCLGSDYIALFNRPVSRFLPGVWQTIEQHLNEACAGDLQVTARSQGGDLQALHCRIEPIAIGDDCLGALLVIGAAPGRRRESAVAQPAVSRYSFDNILGDSPAIAKALQMATAAARDPLDNSVLLVGETGTGKELLAHAIHAEGGRNDGPFIAINCGALPRDLIESELFGYTGGAFTGARRDGQPGKFELAHNGTLFLDEIDSLDPELQAKFLRVLDNKEITRLGSSQPLHVDVRIIAAATPELARALENGRFRLDLYHRLCVLEVRVPALRERGDDVVALAESFLAKESLAAGCQPPQLGPAARDYLRRHAWPGNIRELRNLCIRWLLTARDGRISDADVPQAAAPRLAGDEPAAELRHVEDDLIRRTLAETGGNVSAAARKLGIDRSTIYRRRRGWNDPL
ncbi:transcriptional regulator of acetoin/glycerol metabolism [Methylohalomonas lacus]|uniref:Transcriptional regulator of acetoin/glycerol metabolism n=1 Tax=Methylohalomonas lacus TaxID=398773 RepID=A0AAE3HM88_9GAMM|nr:sigma 54-interacting transcriptional regulator [Methylohalomonas lacus]MCS3903073.1 transcriptional regulator of acetoin/glycerol metabolism [Methylohalomonas lacus]